MKVVAYERIGGQAYEFEAAQVMLYDRYDNPLAVAVDVGMPGQECHYVAKVTDPDFNRTLRNLNIDKVVMCTNFQDPPPKGAKLISSPSL